MSDYGLWIRFDDQSESFTLGFEAGMIYEQLMAGNKKEFTVHTINIPQLETIGKKLGYSIAKREIVAEDWSVILFKRTLVRVK